MAERKPGVEEVVEGCGQGRLGPVPVILWMTCFCVFNRKEKYICIFTEIHFVK